jgi:hypothetical protein
VMTLERAGKMILIGGIFMTSTTLLSHAQDTGRLFDVKIPRSEASPAPFQNVTTATTPGPSLQKPSKEILEISWYWRVLEWLAIGIAKTNTEKQDDGRPYQQGNYH